MDHFLYDIFSYLANTRLESHPTYSYNIIVSWTKSWEMGGSRGIIDVWRHFIETMHGSPSPFKFVLTILLLAEGYTQDNETSS